MQKGTPVPDAPLARLYRRPGFMIRRAHQIAVSLFLEETGALGITTTQYGILAVLAQRPGIDQVSVAKLLGLDRSTTGMVVNKLEEAGLIGRGIGVRDRRRRSLQLTRAGKTMLARLAAPAERAQARVLAPLGPRERVLFLDTLDKLMRSFNGSTRVPLTDGRDQMTDEETTDARRRLSSVLRGPSSVARGGRAAAKQTSARVRNGG